MPGVRRVHELKVDKALAETPLASENEACNLDTICCFHGWFLEP